MKINILLFLFFAITILPTKAQSIESACIFSSDYKNSNDIKSGKGGVFYISGSYQQPLYMQRDSIKGNRLLTATINGKYASLDNEGEARIDNPDEIINIGAMLTYVVPLAQRWNILATAGATLNATPQYVRLQSMALTGGAIFMYRVNKGLNIGIGAIITTTYGQPVIIPTPFITWKRSGKFSIELNMRGLPEMVIATQINKNTKLNITPIAIENFSAVLNIDGENKLYSQRIFKSTISISHRLTRHFTLDAQAGYISYRTARIEERSHKAFWKRLFDSDQNSKFSPSGYFSLALKYHLR